MYVEVYSAVLQGLEANLIGVEIDVSKGLPAFTIVGLAGKSINEARERVTVALKACDFELAPKRILVNLNPAHIKKEGAQLDLAIAVGLMYSFKHIECDAKFLGQFCFLAELSLTGELKPNLGILPLALEAQRNGVRYLIVPKENQDEANLVTLYSKSIQTCKSCIEIFSVNNLAELKALIEDLQILDQNSSYEEVEDDSNSNNKRKERIENFRVPKIDKSNLQNLIHRTGMEKESLDFKDVIGQTHAKRGLEIAAAGNHHVLMIGAPGCGKSMLAKRFKHLLPPLHFDKALESTKIYSICGLLKQPLMMEAPYRAPHHSATAVSLVGGGIPIRPGEISLAHNGVLFLDELTEFTRFVIEQMRQILDEKEITLNKGNQSYTYPANFILITACNPCPCGYLGDPEKQCTCNSYQIARYISKLSGPMLDRIDMHLEIGRLSKQEIAMLSEEDSEPSSLHTELMKEKVVKAKQFSDQLEVEYKGKDKHKSFKYRLDKESKKFLDDAIYSLNLSARSHDKILRIARTIANLEQSTKIEINHLAEAMQFRSVNWSKYIRH